MVPATVVPTALLIVREAPVMVTGPAKIRLFSLATEKNVVSAWRVTLLPTVNGPPVPPRMEPPFRIKVPVP